MKHLPNLLTLGNLFCGCMAIACILSAQPYYYVNANNGLPAFDWVYGSEQMYLGSLFIGIAALCDMLDGLAARALQVFSPIGKDLDSLADVVSFGVAPSAILYKLLFDACVMNKNALANSSFFDVSRIEMAPAFLIACFAALRLAKFNVTSAQQKAYFIGLPTPVVGILIGSLPVILWFGQWRISQFFAHWLQEQWVLYTVIAVLCWLMVSPIRFFKMMPARWNMAHLWPHILLVALTAAAIPFLQMAAVPVAFVLYVVLSLLYRHPNPGNEDDDYEEVTGKENAK